MSAARSGSAVPRRAEQPRAHCRGSAGGSRTGPMRSSSFGYWKSSSSSRMRVSSATCAWRAAGIHRSSEICNTLNKQKRLDFPRANPEKATATTCPERRNALPFWRSFQWQPFPLRLFYVPAQARTTGPRSRVRPLVAAARGRVPHLSRHGLVHDDLGLGGYSLTELVDGFFWARALCRHVEPLQARH